MSNLTKLVPPLDLCKLIPAGEFADSVHWYRWSYIDQKYLVVEGKPDVRLHRDPCPCGMKYFCPAPTLQEIMAEIPFAQVSIFANGSFVIHPRFGEKRNVRCHDDNAATAAMKLWMKLKGIEDEE